ncbi:MAG: hypothetical protein WKF43_04700 [Acidimicrobiales bacterium]
MQVGRPGDGLTEAVARIAGTSRPVAGPSARRPQAIGQLPDQVTPAEIVGSAGLEGGRWILPVGISERTLAPTGFNLYENEHALVAGPARSGRSTVLRVGAAVVRQHAPAVRVAAVAGPRSPLASTPAAHEVLEPVDLWPHLDRLGAEPGPVLVLIDDAELIGDEDGAIAALLGRRRPDLHVVAAGRNEVLRTLYTHWTRTVRQGRSALLLQPDIDLDGDLAGARLPRRSSVALSVGRGYLVQGGAIEIVQTAGRPSGSGFT